MRTRSESALREQERPRGRPRDAAVDEAILGATRSILEEGGANGFSISEVVARSGVSTATIYRRWPSATDLILDGIRSQIPQAVDIDSGRLARDIAQFLDHMASALLSMRGLYTADMHRRDIDPGLREEIIAAFIEPRERLLAAILQRATERGELGSLPELEVCWDYLVGPLHHRLLIRRAGFSAVARKRALQVALATLELLAAD